MSGLLLETFASSPADSLQALATEQADMKCMAWQRLPMSAAALASG
jgi:hypothetical protein